MSPGHDVSGEHCIGACSLRGRLSPGHVVSRGRLSPGLVVSGADSLRGRLSRGILSPGQIVSGAECLGAHCLGAHCLGGDCLGAPCPPTLKPAYLLEGLTCLPSWQGLKVIEAGLSLAMVIMEQHTKVECFASQGIY